MKTLGVRWFNQMGAPNVIGIVLVEMSPMECQEFGIEDSNRVAYLGMGQSFNSEEQDVNHVVLTGARFPVDAAEFLMGMRKP